MALANAKSHVVLNGQNYILIEESYEKRAQQPFSARFATGDPSTGDLSFWQFLTQKGWTGEGQEKFDVVSKYRQSAGWDTRDGKARLGFGHEAVTLTNAMPAIEAPASSVLFDDFEGGFLTSRWSATVATTGEAGMAEPQTFTVAASLKCISGVWKNGNPDFWVNEAMEAAYSGGFKYTAGGEQQFIKVPTVVSTAFVGSWEFDLYTATSGLNVRHARFAFLGSPTGGWVFEASGSNMTTWKLIKTSKSFGTTGFATPCEAAKDIASDTVVLTCAGVVAGTATSVTVKITRTADGLFTIYENGVSRGTVTDTSYPTPGWVGWSTYNAYPSASGSNSTYIDNVKFPGATVQGFGSKFIPYRNALYTCWDTAGADYTFTTLRESAQGSNLPRIVHQVATCQAVWYRAGSPEGDVEAYLAVCAGSTFRCYNGDTSVGGAFSVSPGFFPSAILPIDGDTILIMGTLTSFGSGTPCVAVLKMTTGTWSVASTFMLQLDGATAGAIAQDAALDSSGGVYFATNDLRNALGTFPSRLFYMNATDVMAANPRITASWAMTDMTVRGVVSHLGTVLLYGSKRRGTNAYPAIIKLDGTVVHESTKAVDLSNTVNGGNFYNHGIAAFWKNLDHMLFLGMTSLDLWSPVLQLDAAYNMREVACFDSLQLATNAPNVCAIAEWNGQFFYLNAQAGTITRTTTARGTLGAAHAYAVLELSQMGANTDLINKTLYSVIVELSAVVPTGETLTVLVNDTVVGTMVLADGVRKEMVLASELTAAAFVVKLRWPSASTWAGYISSGPLLKYVPSQFKKRAWGFGIRATKRLKMGDGSHESRTPATMFTDIEAAWASNVPVTFIDVDGTSYSVLVTDFKQKRPLLSIDRQSGNEAFYFVELLQI